MPITSVMDHTGDINYLDEVLTPSRTRSMILCALCDLLSLSHTDMFQIKGLTGQVPSPSVLAANYL